MIEDLRYGLRILVKNPGFAIVAILTMALGIGANTAVFSVINGLLLRPLPGILDQNRLITLIRTQPTGPFDSFGYPDYCDLRDRTQTLTGIAAHTWAPLTLGSERVLGDLVSENYFEVLEAKPAIGRLLAPSDDSDVAVLSYGLWRRRFGGNPSAVGSSVTINGYPFTVVGVTQEGFRGSTSNDAYDVWVPVKTQPRTLPRLSDGILQNRSSGWLRMFGRLKPGVDIRAAEAEMKTIAAQLAAAYPVTNTGRSVSMIAGLGLYPDDRADVSNLLVLVGGAVALLLVIACANVAGLLMVRSTRRTREIAMRVAVGASRVRIIRQLLTEGMLLALIAGVVGFLASQWVTQIIAATNQKTRLLHSMDVSPDVRVFAFTLLACAVAGIVFALVPAAQSSKVDLADALKTGSAGGGYRRSRWRSGMVTAQVALSFILLSASGILLRDVYRIITSNPGFETRDVAMMSIDMSTLPNFEQRGPVVYRQLLERLPAVPGIVSASLAGTVPPYDLSSRVSIFYPGQEPPPDVLRGHAFELGLRVDINRIAPRYFETLGIPLLEGRDFSDRDRGAVIISKKLAERLWPGQDAVGRRIAWPEPGRWADAAQEVIGVAADAKYRSLIADAPLLMYVPALADFDSRTHIVVRTANPTRAIADIQRVVREIDKDVPVFNPETMTAHAAESLWQQRTAASWISVFSLLALILAAIGLYGVIAQSVAQRTREVGIRMALGAAPASVSRLVMREGMTLALAGMAVGIPATVAISRAIRGLLVGIGGTNLLTLLCVAVVLTLVMLLACWIPARRAANVDPIEALRCE
jgi:macrolide transport system ATP-binding/permease protein